MHLGLRCSNTAAATVSELKGEQASVCSIVQVGSLDIPVGLQRFRVSGLSEHSRRRGNESEGEGIDLDCKDLFVAFLMFCFSRL